MTHLYISYIISCWVRIVCSAVCSIHKQRPFCVMHSICLRWTWRKIASSRSGRTHQGVLRSNAVRSSFCSSQIFPLKMHFVELFIKAKQMAKKSWPVHYHLVVLWCNLLCLNGFITCKVHAAQRQIDISWSSKVFSDVLYERAVESVLIFIPASSISCYSPPSCK